MAEAEARRTTEVAQPPAGAGNVMRVLMRGHGSVDYVCGKDQVALARGVDPHLTSGIVFLCSGCGAYSVTGE